MCRRLLPALCVLAFVFVGLGRAERPAASGQGLAPLVKLLAGTDDAELHRDVLRGMLEALQGRRRVARPEGWPAVQRKLAASPDAEVREKAIILSVLFGDPSALDALRKTAVDRTADPSERRRALQTLVETRSADLVPLLRELLDDDAMRGPVLRALAAFRDPGIPPLILGRYAKLSDAEKADAIAALTARPEYAQALLDAMEQGRVPRRDLSAYAARQLLNFRDQALRERLTKVWGTIRQPDQDRAAQLARYLSLVPPALLQKADRGNGRAVFTRLCANCHTVFDAGGKIGPDLTGSQRANPEYVLTKVLDPSAVVAKDYQMTVFSTADGRILSGIVKEENDQTVAVQMPTEVVRLAKKDIESRQQSTQSMMPEGQLAPLSDAEVRDLIAYLAGDAQVPLPKK